MCTFFKTKLDNCLLLKYTACDSSCVNKILLAKMCRKRRNCFESLRWHNIFYVLCKNYGHVWHHACMCYLFHTHSICSQLFSYLLMILFQIMQTLHSSKIAFNKNIMWYKTNRCKFSTYQCIMQVLNTKQILRVVCMLFAIK